MSSRQVTKLRDSCWKSEEEEEEQAEEKATVEEEAKEPGQGEITGRVPSAPYYAHSTSGKYLGKLIEKEETGQVKSEKAIGKINSRKLRSRHSVGSGT
jgi:hypothetical protein